MPILIAVAAVIIIIAGVFFLGSSDSDQTNTATPTTNDAQVEIQVNQEQTDTSIDSETNTEAELPAESNEQQSSNDYQDGTYTVDTDYRVPNGVVHDMVITFDIANDQFQNVSVVFDGKVGGSTSNQERFVNDLQLTGVDIDETNLTRVGGASLTTDAFNDAVVTLRQEATIR